MFCAVNVFGLDSVSIADKVLVEVLYIQRGFDNWPLALLAGSPPVRCLASTSV